MCETVFSSVKRTLGDAVSTRTRYNKFRELVLIRIVHSIKRTVKKKLTILLNLI